MQRRRLLIFGGSLALVAGITGSALALAGQHNPPSLPVAASSVTPSAPAASPAATPAKVAPPVRVIVPSLGINAAVEKLGLCPSSDPSQDCAGVDYHGLATPPAEAENLAGWWDGGYAPGQLGPAVIVGHVNHAGVGNLVFWNLTSIKVGAMIETEPGNLWFRVTGTQEVSKNAFPTATVYNSTGASELRLITCGGQYDPKTGHYLSNFIVYAAAA